MRRKVGVSAIKFDLDGDAILSQDTEQNKGNKSGGRRATRTATLDGGAVVYDTGYSAADREMVVSTRLEYLQWLRRMSQLYSIVRLTTEEGAFQGVPERFRIRDNRAELVILITTEEA